MPGRFLRWIVAAVGAFLALLAVLAIVTAVGSKRIKDGYSEEKDHLFHCARSGPFRPSMQRAVEGLPPPVRKYLQATSGLNEPGLTLAVLKQRGMARTASDKPWMRFEAEQAYSFVRAEFIWLAKIKGAPLLPILVRDRFIEGKGDMLVSLAGLKRLGWARGPEVDSSAGLRYWSEAICFPELVRDSRLRWEAMSARQARMHVSNWGMKMTAVVEFDERGLPSAVHGERYREVAGSYVLTPWSGFMSDWKAIDGRLFPASWESVWRLPEGDLSAIRIENVGLKAE